MAVPERVIRPAGRFNLDVAESWRERELLWFFSMRIIKIRYKQSLAGPGWAVIQPLLTMVVFSLVFGRLAGLPTDGVPYAPFYYAGLVLWTFASNAITSGAGSLVDNQSLISKVYFPRIYLPMSGGVSGLVDLAVATAIVLPIALLAGVSLSWTLLAAPVFVLPTLLGSWGFAMLFSALNAQYRDVRFVVPFVVQAGLFASPIAYSISLVPSAWRPVYAMNPFVGPITGFRWALLGTDWPGWDVVGISLASSLVLFALGLWYFQRVEATIADVV